MADRTENQGRWWRDVLTIAILPAVAAFLGKLSPEYITKSLPELLARPVPLWAVVVAPLGALVVYLSRGRNQKPELVAEHEETLRLYKDLWDDKETAFKERISHLRKQFNKKQAEAAAAAGNLEATREELGALLTNCAAAQGFFVSVLEKFYPLVIETGNRIERAYVSMGRGSREEFDRVFAAGRNVGPCPEGWRPQLAFYSGVLGQLVLDVALMAQLAVELPLGLFEAHRHEPEKEFPELFNEWYETAKIELTVETAVIWTNPQTWAPELLDHWIQTSDIDAPEKKAET